MHMVMKAVCHINPAQFPVLVVNQTLFVICKKIQWTWPESYGEDKMVIMYTTIKVVILDITIIIVLKKDLKRGTFTRFQLRT